MSSLETIINQNKCWLFKPRVYLKNFACVVDAKKAWGNLISGLDEPQQPEQPNHNITLRIEALKTRSKADENLQLYNVTSISSLVNYSLSFTGQTARQSQHLH